MDIQFHIQGIKVNGMEASSAFNIGTILQIGFGSHTKTLNGTGTATGDHSAAPALFGWTDDRDQVDTPDYYFGMQNGLRSPFGA
ncbi:MAG: hypothetical protein ACOY5W_17155 [Pseudomonadota bacterium]